MNNTDLRAPKDAIPKRPGFYIIKDKMLEATLRADQTRSQETYLNDGRLENAAKIVGNIQDDEMLSLLGNAKGFREMVHSIGISITSENEKACMQFKLIFYGEHQSDSGGTTELLTIMTDGIEKRILLEDIQWSNEDRVLGQFAFLFPKDLQYATASVKLYVKEGYKVPLEEEMTSPDLMTQNYMDLIAKSLITTGNNGRMKKVIEKMVNGERVNLAFIGGSITQGAGAVPIARACYAYLFYQAFAKEFGVSEAKLGYVKAGIGGTSSELGVVRYDLDVLGNGEYDPDLVVIEFAVNDEGDETKGECYEGLIRKALSGRRNPAVILLFSVFADDSNLEERLIPIGETYDLPMISIKRAMTEQFYRSYEEGKVISKAMFYYDAFHPSNLGHKVMSDCLINYVREVSRQTLQIDPFATSDLFPIAKSSDFENVIFFDRNNYKYHCNHLIEGSFCEYDQELQSVERNQDPFQTPVFSHNWMHRKGTENSNVQLDSREFSFEINCKSLMIVMKDSGNSDFGKAKVYVDGMVTRVLDPLEIGWTHCNALIVLREKKSKDHVIRIQMVESDRNKAFTILGFGYVQ